MSVYKRIIRPLLFRMDPESVHNLTIQFLRISGNLGLDLLLFNPGKIAHSQYSVIIKNLTFPNKVGLAAGYDKNGVAWKALSSLGFGHIELGTVTPRPQYGNPKPRIFRIPEEKAIINRMGFPGNGADYVAKQLLKRRPSKFDSVIGVNIGKNKDTPNEDAVKDYLFLLEKFAPLVDYIAINVSSPNTIGLRSLQARDQLESLLSLLNRRRVEKFNDLPIFVKIAPDLTGDQLYDALTAILNTKMDGIIATNTTVDRMNLASGIKYESGGLSGRPLYHASLSMVENIYKETSGRLPIIGVGGIFSYEDAKSMFDVGASLIQLYSGLIFEGPRLVKNILVLS